MLLRCCCRWPRAELRSQRLACPGSSHIQGSKFLAKLRNLRCRSSKKLWTAMANPTTDAGLSHVSVQLSLSPEGPVDRQNEPWSSSPATAQPSRPTAGHGPTCWDLIIQYEGQSELTCSSKLFSSAQNARNLVPEHLYQHTRQTPP